MSLGVKEYYDANAAYEWGRLDRHPYEFAITKYMMDKFIKPGQSVLDIGGGPGRYSIYLAQKGCDVTLLDLSEGNISYALQKSIEAGVKLRACAQNCLTVDPGEYGQYDHVLLMGPLYHMWNAADREAAVQAALDCLKPGGYFYASFILTFAHILYNLQHPETVQKTFYSGEGDEILRAIKNHENWGCEAFTYLYSWDPANILPFMSKFDLERVTLFGQEGILSPNYTSLIQRSGEAQKLWINIALELCEMPEFLNYSEHAMYIGRKPLPERR